MNLPDRKTQRLKNYDYSQKGYYFINICTHNKEHLFGKIMDGQVVLNKYGSIAQQELANIPMRYANVELNKFVVMPNHIHIILIVNDFGSLTERSRPFPTVPKIIGLYKSGVSRLIRELRAGVTVWQKSYYDHIIRTEEDYQDIWQYIDTNPLKWENDKYFTT